VRPSPGAAISELPAVPYIAETQPNGRTSAPEDGRTPSATPSADDGRQAPIP